MLDAVYIVSKSGVVLWSKRMGHIDTTMKPVDELIVNVLLPEKMGLSQYIVQDKCVLKWHLVNTHDIIVIAVYMKQMASFVSNVDTLLKALGSLFISMYGEKILTLGAELTMGIPNPSRSMKALAGSSALVSEETLEEFDNGFDNVLDLVEKGDSLKSILAQVLSSNANTVSQENEETLNDTLASNNGPLSSGREGEITEKSDDNEDDKEFSGNPTLSGLAALQAKRLSGGSKKTTSSKDRVKQPTSANKVKEGRVWADDFKYDEKAASSFNKNTAADSNEDDSNIERVIFSGNGSSGAGSDFQFSKASKSKIRSADEEEAESTSWFSSSSVGSWFQSISGSKVLQESDLKPIGELLKEQLISKNVAIEIADDICKSVVSQLKGTKLSGSIISTPQKAIAASMRQALSLAIEKILTPSRPIDIVREAKAHKSRLLSAGKGNVRPFVIVVCGVNGVGKSTTLSKLAYLLRDHSLSVMIAACDSFRAGAIEQLKRHCTALGAQLFQQGYAKNPVLIAGNAIRLAEQQGIDVVLVDTAGRMQNNVQLMQQLASLVSVNAPNLVLFVGEALVGSDGVNQLVEFDRALVDMAVDVKNPRKIDGIVLTKFDTVDDKVGAALSMVYRTRIPVAYLGVGQQYPDLRRLNVDAVVSALLS